MSGIPGGESLHRLVFAVLEHTMRELVEGGTVDAALIVEKGTGESTITRFEAATVEAGVRAARKAAATSGAERVAVRWDGTVEAGGESHAAIYVLAQEIGQPRSHVFVQRHTPVGAEVSPLGNPGYLGEQDPLLP